MKEYREAKDPSDAHARYVWVDDNGVVRTLTAEEAAYLAMPFQPPDGGRPYVKERYGARTPDGKLRGFLERKKVPPGVEITSSA